jgi:hypothetical protein
MTIFPVNRGPKIPVVRKTETVKRIKTKTDQGNVFDRLLDETQNTRMSDCHRGYKRISWWTSGGPTVGTQKITTIIFFSLHVKNDEAWLLRDKVRTKENTYIWVSV